MAHRGGWRSYLNYDPTQAKPHIDRLWHSAAVHGLKIKYTKDELLKATMETIKKNGFRTNVYIQPRIWPKAGAGSRYAPEEFHIVIPTWLFDTCLGKGNPRFSEERRFMVSSWRRVASDALPPQEVLGQLRQLGVGDPRGHEEWVRRCDIPRLQGLRL